MKTSSKIIKPIKRAYRIMKVMQWKRYKARLAYEAWINDEYQHGGARIFQD